MPPYQHRLQVSVHPGNWRTVRSLMPPLLRAIEQQSAIRSKIRKSCFVELSILPNTEMQRLNRRFRGKRTIPNVLSFRYNTIVPGTQACFLGEVLIAYPHVKRDAKRFRRDWKTHGTYLIVHGILHLLGWDHQNAKAAQRMEQLEDHIISITQS